jgi:hypothetical protein
MVVDQDEWDMQDLSPSTKYGGVGDYAIKMWDYVKAHPYKTAAALGATGLALGGLMYSGSIPTPEFIGNAAKGLTKSWGHVKEGLSQGWQHGSKILAPHLPNRNLWPNTELGNSQYLATIKRITSGSSPSAVLRYATHLAGRAREFTRPLETGFDQGFGRLVSPTGSGMGYRVANRLGRAVRSFAETPQGRSAMMRMAPYVHTPSKTLESVNRSIEAVRRLG